MLLTKNEALIVLSSKLMDKRIKPMLDTMIQYRLDNPKPIKYNKALDDDDYVLWKSRQENKTTMINNRSTHASLMQIAKDVIVVVNKKLSTISTPCIEQQQEEVVLLWQKQIHENYMKHRMKGGGAK